MNETVEYAVFKTQSFVRRNKEVIGAFVFAAATTAVTVAISTIVSNTITNAMIVSKDGLFEVESTTEEN